MKSHITQNSNINIPVNYIRIIALELGLSLKELPQLLQFTGITTDDLLQDDTRIQSAEFIQVFKNAIYLSRQSDFGLKLGLRLKPSAHGAMGLIIRSCPNLEVAIESIRNFLPTRLSFARAEIFFTKTSVICSLDFSEEIKELCLKIMSETCMMVFSECAKFILGRPLSEATIFFKHPADHTIHYLTYFDSNIQFDSTFLGIEIPLATCEIPNAMANQADYLAAKIQCEQLLNDSKTASHSYTHAVKKIMIQESYRTLSEAEIASMLFVSQRTLARHLLRENTSFTDIKNELFKQQSEYYLAQTTLSIEAIALNLNYHDASNFRRAFRRIFKMTPQQYRRSISQSETFF